MFFSVNHLINIKRGSSLVESHKTNKQKDLPYHLILLQALRTYLLIHTYSSSSSPDATEFWSTTVYPAWRSWAHNKEWKLRPKIPQNLQAKEAHANKFQSFCYSVIILSPVRQLAPVQSFQVGLQICSCRHQFSIPRSPELGCFCLLAKIWQCCSMTPSSPMI